MTSPSLSLIGRTTRAWALSLAGLVIGAAGARPGSAYASSSGAITPGSDISLTQVALIVVILAGVIALASSLLRRERSEGHGDPELQELGHDPSSSDGLEGGVDGETRTARITSYDVAMGIAGSRYGNSHGDGNGLGHVSPDLTAIRQEVINRFPELGDYPMQLCRDFVAGLGDAVIDRALVMFTMLRDRGEITSAELSQRLEVPVMAVSGRLTGRIARRATELQSELPYEVVRPTGGGTVWLDRQSIAGRMVTALADERGRRDHVQANYGKSNPS